MLVSVSVPAKVANDPEVGNVTPVLPVVVSVVVCAPLVVKAPPSVTASPPILATVNAPALIVASPDTVVHEGSPLASATSNLPLAPAAKADGSPL